LTTAGLVRDGPLSMPSGEINFAQADFTGQSHRGSRIASG
jgi:hypothetical protein